MLPGKEAANRRGSLGERFSSKSSFMRNEGYTTVLLSSEREACLDIVSHQIGEVIEHLGNAHTAAQVVEDIGDSDASPPNAGFPTPNARINGDALSVIHAERINGGFG
jgi:hypothetical protein